MKVVRVEWTDAYQVAEWCPMESDVLTPALIISIGWVVRETENYLLIARDQGKGMASGRIAIPAKSINRVENILDEVDE